MLNPMSWEFQNFTIRAIGIPGEMRDRIVRMTLDGVKTATSSLAVEYGDGPENTPLPQPGDGQILVDSDGRPVAVLRTTRVDLVPFGEIPLDYAQAENIDSVDVWQERHAAFWEKTLPDTPITDETVVVCHRFELVAKL